MAPALAGWTPIRFYRDGGRAMVDWCEMGPTRFVDPFFHETVERVLARPAASLLRRQTPVEDLVAAAGAEPGMTPAGFIFHTSRSGSTLLSQMLAASANDRVLSEPDPVDEVLRTGYRDPVVPVGTRATWLRSMLSALGRPQGVERRLFVKLDPWHILDFPLIREVFPDVPWVLSCREPLEVLVSQARSPGSQFVVGPLPTSLFGLDLATAAMAAPGRYAAHVLDRILKAAALHLDDGGLVVDHAELPGGFGAVLDHFGVQPDDGELAAMQAAATFDAKRPGQPYAPDAAAKRAEADDALRAAADAVRPAYERLLAARDRSQRVMVR
jgi:hypothetical protein